MAELSALERVSETAIAEIVGLMRAKAETLPPPERFTSFGPLFDRYGDARIVLLGEATHGTSEFYRSRAAITRQLIERHGFTIVAVEADWPDAARIDRSVRGREGRTAREAAFDRFPAWMWRNVETRDFVDWLRVHNAALPADSRVEFRGLDIYSLYASIEAVLSYLRRIDPDAAESAAARYGCLSPWHGDPPVYGRQAMRSGDDCEDEVVEQLTALLGTRVEEARAGDDDFFDAVQNARVVRTAERYYRVMYRGSTESWNLRDRHMFDTLQAILRRRGRSAKAVVWAHNSHIGNAATTAMGWAGEFNLGEFCRTAYGDGALLIGFGTDRGTVAAASDWGAPMEVKTVLPARGDSYEHLFRRTGLARSLTDWRAPAALELREALAGPRLERAIGVVYRPETELLSHYFEAVLPEQFDAYVWFEETKAVAPLRGPVVEDAVPDTYPSGL